MDDVAALAAHRIDRVEPFPVVTRYPRTVGRNARLGWHGDGPTSTAVVVRTGAGAAGWGLVAGRLEDPDRLVGRRLDEVFDPTIGVIEDAAAPLDFALHDLAGQILGRSVAQLIGGRGQQAVTCYDGAIYFDDLDPDHDPRGIDAILDNCAADRELGYTGFKAKIGRGNRWMDPAAGLARDIAVTRAVRAAYPDARILVDANDGYTGEEFGHYLDAVADCDLYWIEEPFPENAADLTRLKDRLGHHGATTLIADGEYEPDVAHVLDLATRGLLDVLIMDIISHGLTRWRALMPRLREIGVHASPHAWGLPLKTLYAAQLAAGLGNIHTVEGVPGSTDGVDTTAYALHDGMLRVPDRPGFGIPLPE